jgi:DNA-directed RNA polymerase subunit H (RpoH/RPB5)
MLSDRKIDISNIENIQVNEIKKLFKIDSTTISKQQTVSMIAVLDVNENFRILFSLSKFKFADIKKYLADDKLNHIMIVTKDKLSSTNYKSFDNNDEYNKIEFEYFMINELKFNISKHILVPKHEILTDTEEIADIMKEYKIKIKSQLPIISKEDPMSKYLNAKTGDLIRIIRNSPTSGIYNVYRYCL